jgi:hypothetical protein
MNSSTQGYPSFVGSSIGYGYHLFRNVGAPTVNNIVKALAAPSPTGGYDISGLSGTYGGSRWGLVIGSQEIHSYYTGLPNYGNYYSYAPSPNITSLIPNAYGLSNPNTNFSYGAKLSNGSDPGKIYIYEQYYDEGVGDYVIREGLNTYYVMSLALNIPPA